MCTASLELARKLGIVRFAKKAVNRALASVGLELRPLRKAHLDMLDCLRHFRKCGAQPATVIDVGVGIGTFALYEAFPEATHVLVEPLSEFKDDIARIQKSL